MTDGRGYSVSAATTRPVDESACTTNEHHRQGWVRSQWRTVRSLHPLQWLLFAAGTALIAIGIGAGVLSSGMGAGPAEALFAGAAGMTPVTVGTWAIIISVGLMVFNRLMGQPVLIGTIFFVVGFGVLVDVAMFFAPSIATVPGQAAQWLIGAVLLAIGAGLTIASGVGASAYDTATVAIASRVGGRLGVARVILDGVALVFAFVLGGPIAVGTVGLMVVFPLVMPLVVRVIRSRLPESAPQ